MSKPQSKSAPLRVVALPGDGVGPEVTEAALGVLRLVCEKAERGLEVQKAPIGGAALDALDDPFPKATEAACANADAVLLGAVGGPKWDDVDNSIRPEKGLLRLRTALGVFANLRPIRAYPALIDSSPLKADRLEGTDMVIVRELLGGIYFGGPREWNQDEKRAFNTMVYSNAEVERVARVAFELARKRQGRVCSIDKANVLEVSRLWRDVVTRLQSSDYPDVELSHQYVDSAAMDLIRNPSRFDVVLTGNMFGDILSDEASVLAGSIGLLPSASLGEGPGLYEPIHGSAPDIAGQGIANPLGTIASVAAMCRSSLGMPEAAAAIEQAIDLVLEDGHRTPDLGGSTTTAQMGEQVCRALEAR